MQCHIQFFIGAARLFEDILVDNKDNNIKCSFKFSNSVFYLLLKGCILLYGQQSGAVVSTGICYDPRF